MGLTNFPGSVNFETFKHLCSGYDAAIIHETRNEDVQSNEVMKHFRLDEQIVQTNSSRTRRSFAGSMSI